MASADNDGAFSEQERLSIRERAKELKTEAKRSKAADKAAADLKDQLTKIASMPDGDRQMAERLHEIVTRVAPELSPKLYYGQPGYSRDGKVLVFFRSGQMDKERYSTLGFSQQAQLDSADGFWPSAYALTEPTATAWKQVEELVKAATTN
ncbi:MAG: DUF1801 domain-containing protein [Cryobacterium sp.]|nr:DUF1801 domain-containing protein [Cryobacterium sp.]